MTIKRGRWAARIPGLRWGGQQVRRELLAMLDFETRSFVGLDLGRKDEGAMVIATRLPSGRVLYAPIKPPTKEEAESIMKEYRMVFPYTQPSRLHRSDTEERLPIVETVDYSEVEARILADLRRKTDSS